MPHILQIIKSLGPQTPEEAEPSMKSGATTIPDIPGPHGKALWTEQKRWLFSIGLGGFNFRKLPHISIKNGKQLLTVCYPMFPESWLIYGLIYGKNTLTNPRSSKPE